MGVIAVTGATGFIGSALVWKLNEMGHRDILCVDVCPPKSRPGLLDKRTYSGFLNHGAFLDYLKKPERTLDWVIHMGACSQTTEMDRRFLYENNTLYSQKLFEFCTQQGVPFIYASSAACYGDGTMGFDDGRDPNELEPLNPYGESKVEMDRWVVRQDQFPPFWMGLRFFNVYGPNEYYKKDMSSVFFKAYRQICVTGSLKLFRSHHPDYLDGEQLRDFVYIKEITHWLGEILSFSRESRCWKSGIYNMGFGQARTWLDLAQAMFAKMNKEMKIEWVDIPESIRPRYQYFTQAPMGRFLSQGFRSPQWSLELGVEDYVNYLGREDPFL